MRRLGLLRWVSRASAALGTRGDGIAGDPALPLKRIRTASLGLGVRMFGSVGAKHSRIKRTHDCGPVDVPLALGNSEFTLPIVRFGLGEMRVTVSLPSSEDLELSLDELRRGRSHPPLQQAVGRDVLVNQDDRPEHELIARL